MDMQTYGKDLVDILAQRSLDALRTTHMPDMREVLSGRIFRTEPSVSVAAAVGVLVAGVAIGAGIAALVTPTSGPDLRKRFARSTKSAGSALSSMGTRMVGRLTRAGRAVEHSVERSMESMSAASPLTSKQRSTAKPPAASPSGTSAKRAAKSSEKIPAKSLQPTNGHSKRTARQAHA